MVTGRTLIGKSLQISTFVYVQEYHKLFLRKYSFLKNLFVPKGCMHLFKTLEAKDNARDVMQSKNHKVRCSFQIPTRLKVLIV